MKQLVILRHGKAEHHSMDKDDYDRGLTERGRRNAADMGKFLNKKSGRPDLILSSSAKRALQTAQLAARGMEYVAGEIAIDQDLYFASAKWILDEVSKLPDEVDYCLYVGHNPGLTDLINSLGVNLDNLPTASAICFDFQVDDWSHISPERANFKWLKLAREL